MSMRSQSVSRVRRVFFVSPGDLRHESRLFAPIIEDINRYSLNHTGDRVIGIEWHDSPKKTRPSESDFGSRFTAEDLVVMLLWKRWGRQTGKFSSYFTKIYSLAQKRAGAIWFCFRDIPDRLLIRPDDHASRVISFRDKIEKDRSQVFFWYDDISQWQIMISDRLQQWVKGRKISAAKVNPLRSHYRRMAGWTRNLKQMKNPERKTAFRLARRAFELAKNGRLTRACQAFACAVGHSHEPYIINEYGIFLKENGLLNKAMEIFEQLARLGHRTNDNLVIGSGQRHLGHISELKGDFATAENYYHKALAMEKGLGRKLKEASLHHSRGRMHKELGFFDRAKKQFNKALPLFCEIDFLEGQAMVYYSLIDLCLEEEDWTGALEAGEKTVALLEKMDKLELAKDLREKLNLIRKTVKKDR